MKKKKKKKVHIKNIELIGIKPEQEFNLFPAATINQNRVNIYNKFPEDPYNASETYLRDSNDKRVENTLDGFVKFGLDKNVGAGSPEDGSPEDSRP